MVLYTVQTSTGEIFFRKEPKKCKCALFASTDHADLTLADCRMALQLALTTLESVAVMLNERKRESEQSAAFHAKLRSGGSKLAKSEARERVLLREDDVQQLEFNNFGQVCVHKIL